MFKKIIIIMLLLMSCSLATAGEDYYVESDYNLTVPVNVGANNVSYLLVDLDTGFTPSATDVYDFWETTQHDVDWISGTAFNPKNTTCQFTFYLVGSESNNQYGLANSIGGNNRLYVHSRTAGVDVANLISVVDGTTYTDQLRNDQITGPYVAKLYINTTDVYCEILSLDLSSVIYTGELSDLPNGNLSFYYDEIGGGYIQSMRVRQFYDNAPTITVSKFSDSLALITINNTNDFALTEYQVTFDTEFVDQTDESINITAYTTLDIPVPISPIDNTNLVYEYPPIVNDVTLQWTTTAATSYDYEVRTLGGTLIASGATANNYTTVALPDGNYYWSVEGNVEQTMDTIITHFTVSSTYITEDFTAIVGTVYDMQNGVKTPIPEAVVYLYNDTYTDHQTVGADGYFSFVELKANDTYYVKASATDYDNSEISAVTSVGGNTTVNDILLVLSASQYAPHYVKYTVKDIWDTRYSDVAVDVYRGSSVGAIAYRSAITGADGSVSFRLDENQQYTLTFIYLGQGIDETLTHYPREEDYKVYVITQTIIPDDQYSSEELDISVSKQTINNTHAYINVTYVDNLNETTGLSVYLNQSILNDPFNQTVIDSYSGVSNSTIISFIVEDYAGETYFVNIDVDHITFGDVERTYAVQFDGMEDAHGFSQVYIWLAIGGIMFSGMIFKATNARQGAFVVCVVAWIFIILGWFDNLGDKGVLAITAGVTLATILSIAAIMAKGEKEG